MVKCVTRGRGSRVCLSREEGEREGCGSNLYRARRRRIEKTTLDRRQEPSERLVSSVNHVDAVEVVRIV
jgi:hypothetical protein